MLTIRDNLLAELAQGTVEGRDGIVEVVLAVTSIALLQNALSNCSLSR